MDQLKTPVLRKFAVLENSPPHQMTFLTFLSLILRLCLELKKNIKSQYKYAFYLFSFFKVL